MPMTLLRTKEEWESYQVRAERMYREAHKLVGGIAWGSGPADYPCLVASVLTYRPTGQHMTAGVDLRPTITSCYVYPDDARTLLQAALGAGADAEPGPARATTDSGMSEFCRSVSANLCTIVQELCDLKITNPERYEKIYARHLSGIDQVDAERIATSPGRLFQKIADSKMGG